MHISVQLFKCNLCLGRPSIKNNEKYLFKNVMLDFMQSIVQSRVGIQIMAMSVKTSAIALKQPATIRLDVPLKS